MSGDRGCENVDIVDEGDKSQLVCSPCERHLMVVNRLPVRTPPGNDDGPFALSQSRHDRADPRVGDHHSRITDQPDELLVVKEGDTIGAAGPDRRGTVLRDNGLVDVKPVDRAE